MKKTLLLAALFLVLGAGAWYALRAKKNQSGTVNSWDIEFAVKNTDDIGKIFIADRRGRTATLELKDGAWIYNGKYPARPTSIETLLQTLRHVTVQRITTIAAEDAMIKSLASEGLKVEIYDKKGQKVKCYYVGGVTNDEKGTYMIMEGAERPYVVHIPSFTGQVRVRYMLGDDLWRDRAVFSEKPEEIQSVSIEYPQNKSESFRLEKLKEGNYKVQPYFSTTAVNPSPQRKGVPEGYLLQFERMLAEGYETDNPLRDSVAALVPFAIVKIKRSNGSESQTRFWPLEVKRDAMTGKQYVERYFVEKEGADFLLVQHRVFGVVFKPYSFFFENPQRSVKQ